MSSKLKILARNSLFLDKIDLVLDEFCKNRALLCSETMQELIFEQTHAIHFEMIKDFFEGCRQFEREFLDGRNMEEVTKRVREGLEDRKHKLRVTDIYSRETSGVSHDMIYEEVRIQFWVIKMLLSAPLTTKLYMYFVKDIKDKSKHVAVRTTSRDLDLEEELQKKLLYSHNELDPTKIEAKISSSILDSFGLAQNREQLAQKIEGLKRALEYVKLAYEGVAKLQSDIKIRGKVDFLTRLSGNGIEFFEDSVED